MPGSLWSDDLFQLLALCCCQPSLLGFSHSDIKTMEKLEHTVGLEYIVGVGWEEGVGGMSVVVGDGCVVNSFMAEFI